MIKSQWITWELFEEIYDCPASAFPERCNFDNRTIFIGFLNAQDCEAT